MTSTCLSILMVAMTAMAAALMAVAAEPLAAEPLELAAAAARVITLETQVLPAAIPEKRVATQAVLASRPWV